MPQKPDIPFEDFLMIVAAELQPFAAGVDACLLQNGCTRKIEPAKNGYLVSYAYAPAGQSKKRTLANFVFRKGGLVTRVYGDCVGGYAGFLDTVAPDMREKAAKAPVCKNLTAPGTCSPHCSMGYDYEMGGTRHQKCKYNAFLFPVSTENAADIRAFIEREMAARNALTAGA